MVSKHPSTWSKQLLRVEYAHNTLTSSATGLSPFQCAYGFQPPVSCFGEGGFLPICPDFYPLFPPHLDPGQGCFTMSCNPVLYCC